MKKLFVAALVLSLFACNNQSNNVTVTGNVRYLKKGTLYLQKFVGTTFVTVDSVVVTSEKPFELKASIEEPEVLHLTLNDNSTKENRISFFANEGVTEINTTLKGYFFDAKINGCDQQKLYEEYKEIAKKFDNDALDLLKEQFDADSEGDTVLVKELITKADKNLKRKYLYAINFALNNKESEVAPYIALSEVYDANIKFLDTIYNSLPNNIAESKYGLELDKYIKERKESETETKE